MIVYRCEDSLESIFTAIYNAYEDKRKHSETMISTAEDPILFAEDVIVEADQVKARKVMRTLRLRFGEENCKWICMALSCEKEEKAQAVYRTVTDAFSRRAGVGGLFDNMTDPFVRLSYRLGQRAWNECHHLMGFVRFRELEKGILYARIGPENNILSFLMPHFADRFSMEHFMIYDEKRNLFGLHQAGKPWYLMQGAGSSAKAEDLKLSAEEPEYQELFRFFCSKISIEARRNHALQQKLLPLRFQKYMAEFE